MPGEAVRLNAATSVLSPAEIAAMLSRYCRLKQGQKYDTK